ncbi:xanthine dehydrogenase family protein subunit M [Iodidimonas sp. SYSU 1G8]|uniref:FAD binding domain-containing protein n=1 Tax=Iodidimonas sp. SYSU 1G8 TaxID=3133967 RepID=UPI0031FF13B6
MQYQSPASVEEAVAALASVAGARVLAGGTDLLVQLRAGSAAPGAVIDVKRIAEMRTISDTGNGFRIGAAVCGADITDHAALAQAWPGVVEAAGLIGSTQVQGRASLGGNVCNASPAADTTPALIAARAVAEIVGPNGRRSVPVEQIATGPGRTSLAAGEIVASFLLPARPARSGDAYLRMIPRTEMDIAVAGAAVNLTLDADGAVADARVGIGAVAPTALLLDGAAEILIGSRLDDAVLAKLAELAGAAARPIDDKRGTIDYRRKVVGVLAKRATLIAFERAGAR